MRGVNILQVPPRHAERLGQAILDLLQDRAVRERMGREAAHRVEIYFTIDKTADSLEAIMEEILGSKEAHMERNEFHTGGNG